MVQEITEAEPYKQRAEIQRGSRFNAVVRIIWILKPKFLSRNATETRRKKSGLRVYFAGILDQERFLG